MVNLCIISLFRNILLGLTLVLSFLLKKCSCFWKTCKKYVFITFMFFFRFAQHSWGLEWHQFLLQDSCGLNSSSKLQIGFQLHLLFQGKHFFTLTYFIESSLNRLKLPTSAAFLLHWKLLECTYSQSKLSLILKFWIGLTIFHIVE